MPADAAYLDGTAASTVSNVAPGEDEVRFRSEYYGSNQKAICLPLNSYIVDDFVGEH